MAKQYEYLTQEDIDHFLEHGYVVIKGAFTPEQSREWTKDVWVRLGMDPNDKRTWTKEKVNMPWHSRRPVEEFAPKAWAAMKDLLGGEQRIHKDSAVWSDAFIVNLGAEKWEGENNYIAPQELDNWHVDGDFFVHFLDSPEQALLVIPLYEPIKPRGGGTMICPEGISRIAHYLAAHPEGVVARDLTLFPSTSDYENKGEYEDPAFWEHLVEVRNTYKNKEDDPGHWSHLQQIKSAKNCVELTGDIGDVVLMHPLMWHSASKNHLRAVRIITNPPVSLNEPFNFNRENPEDFSLVEKKTLRALGVDKYDFKPETPRRGVLPKRVIIQKKMLEEEKNRLEALKESEKPLVDAAARPIVVAQ